VTALRDRVSATVDKSVHEDQAHIAIRLKNGKTLEKFVEHAIGSVDRPMTDADLEAKFRGLAHAVLQPAATDRLIGLCWRAETLEDIGEVARAAVPQK
jgi:2-methylcitrate dehydratase PrpD